MSLRARLYLACGAIILVLLAPSAFAVSRMAELRDIAFDLRTRHAAAFLTLGRLQTSLAELNRLQRSHVAAPGEEAREGMFRALQDAEAQLARLGDTGYGEEASAQAATVAGLRRATLRLDSLVGAGRFERATAHVQDIRPLFAEAQSEITRLAELIDVRSTAAAQRAQELSARTAETATIALGIAVFVALLVGLFAVGALTSPLPRLRTAMASVAEGRFDALVDLPYGRGDELGDLCRSFRSMALQLAELDRVKAEFVSIASHELKTPVSVIEGYAEMLEDGVYGDVAEKQKEILHYIREQTQVLTERVNQLLSLSRFEAGGLEISVSSLRLQDLVEDLRHTFTVLASQKRIDFAVEASETAPDVLEVDPDRVRHELLGNVLSNAFKFTPEEGRIRLRIWGEGERVVFEIEDTGEGIPRSQLPYIFEKYYQAGRHAGKVGAGLGLAIAREIAEAHGGSVEAESETGRGTRFRIRLPVRRRGGRPGTPDVAPVARAARA